MKCAFCVGMSGFVFGLCDSATANLTNSILTPRDASKWKTQRIAVMEDQQTNWVRDLRLYQT